MLNQLSQPVGSVSRWVGVKRYRPVPFTVDELPDIDAVCISHNHYDHLDYPTLCQLNKRFGDKIHWFVPMGLCSWMKDSGCENVVELEWWDEHPHPKLTDESKAVTFAFTPSQHWCRRGVFDMNRVLWGSWTVIGPCVHVTGSSLLVTLGTAASSNRSARDMDHLMFQQFPLVYMSQGKHPIVVRCPVA